MNQRGKDVLAGKILHLDGDKKYSENLKKKKKFSTLHAFIHPYEALINSNTYFNNLMNERDDIDGLVINPFTKSMSEFRSPTQRIAYSSNSFKSPLLL